MDDEYHECEDFDSDGEGMHGAAAVGEAGRRSVSQLFSGQGKHTRPLDDTSTGDAGTAEGCKLHGPGWPSCSKYGRGPSDAPDSNASRFITLEELEERLLDQQRQHEHTHLSLLKRLDTLTQANEQMQRNFAQRLTQLQTQHQHQQAGWQEELQGVTEDNLHQAHQHIEQVDKTGRLSSLVMKGIRAPAGGRGALTLHVQDLLLTHAGVAKQSIADVSCIGPLGSNLSG